MLYDIKDRGSIQFPIVGGLPLRPLKEDKSVPLCMDLTPPPKLRTCDSANLT